MATTIAEIKKNAETKMHKSVEALKHELQKIRTGRAHPGLLDQVQPFVDVEQQVFQGPIVHGNDNAIENARGPFRNVDVPVMDGIK